MDSDDAAAIDAQAVRGIGIGRRRSGLGDQNNLRPGQWIGRVVRDHDAVGDCVDGGAAGGLRTDTANQETAGAERIETVSRKLQIA